MVEMTLSISIECKDLDVMRIYTVVLEDPCNNVKPRDRNHKTKNDSFSKFNKFLFDGQ